jgi:hypothetical protein
MARGLQKYQLNHRPTHIIEIMHTLTLETEQHCLAPPSATESISSWRTAVWYSTTLKDNKYLKILILHADKDTVS